MIGAAFIIVQFIEFMYLDNFHLSLETFGIKIWTALTSLIYRKVLKINLSQRDDLSIGKIITLITRDVNEFDISVLYSTLLWYDSILFFVTCYLIYLEVGSLVVVLLGIFCFIILIQGKWFFKCYNLLISSCSVSGKNIGCIKNKNTKDNRPDISSNQRDDRRYHANKILHLGRKLQRKSLKN
jgi:ABC-type siderophore export system fused ATPase/permease subunit